MLFGNPPWPTASDTDREIFVTGLRNAHALEYQALALMGRQIEHLAHYAEVEGRMRAHMAVYVVFGTDVAYLPIGSAYGAGQAELVNPNRYQGNYFMPNVPEGIVIPMSSNSFRYPHPMLPLESFT